MIPRKLAEKICKLMLQNIDFGSITDNITALLEQESKAWENSIEKRLKKLERPGQ